jgi:hypothetical protein
MKLDKIRFAKLVSYLTNMLERSLSPVEIEDLDIFIDVDAPPVNKDALGSMLRAIKNGQKIEAIKWHRNITGCGLKDSKDEIEAYWPEPVPYKSAPIFQTDLLTQLDNYKSDDHILRNFSSADIEVIRNYIQSFDVYK